MKSMGICRWLVLSALSGLIGWGTLLPPATAQTQQVELTINSYGNQTFESLMQEAASLARTAIEEAFAESPNLPELSIVIMGERNGQIVPLVMATVSRSNWQQDSRLERWIRYFASSEVLLGFRDQEELEPNPSIVQPPNRGSIRVRTANGGVVQLNTGRDSNLPDYGDGRGFDDEED